jgi:hypothetical protein
MHVIRMLFICLYFLRERLLSFFETKNDLSIILKKNRMHIFQGSFVGL